MEEHIVQSGDKYCLRSKKTNKNLGCYDSRSGAENREKQVQYFKHVNEMSGAGGAGPGGVGSIEGPGSPFMKKMKGPWKKQKFDESVYVNRITFLEEIILREKIQYFIKETFIKSSLEEEQLRNVIRRSIAEEFVSNMNRVLTEAKAKTADKSVHASTGINVLEDVLKKIIPQLEQDYKTMTTNPEQRESFRAHILNAVNKTLTTADINQQADVSGDSMNIAEGIFPPAYAQDAPPLEDDVNVKVGEPVQPGDEDKFIDINKKPGGDEEIDTFGIAGKDVTGRNMAQMTYDKIEKNIVDSYGLLSDNEDKKLFYDYLLTNLKLYFDKFESEIESDVKEPEVEAEPGAEEPTGEEPGGSDLGAGLSMEDYSGYPVGRPPGM